MSFKLYREYVKTAYPYIFSGNTSFELTTTIQENKTLNELSPIDSEIKDYLQQIDEEGNLLWTNNQWTHTATPAFSFTSENDVELFLYKIRVYKGSILLLIAYENENDIIYKHYSILQATSKEKQKQFIGDNEIPVAKEITINNKKYTIKALQIQAFFDAKEGCAFVQGTFNIKKSSYSEFDRDDFFLQKFDYARIKDQHVRLILLDRHSDTFNSENMTTIEGMVLSGSIQVNNSAAIKRTGNMTMLVDEKTRNILSTTNLITTGVRFVIEVGFTNFTAFYPNNPIIWFPEGIFLVTDCSLTEDTQGLKLQVSFKDKSVLLNGELGGIIPGALNLNKRTLVTEDGEIVNADPLLKDIIYGLVTSYGGLKANEVIISVPTKVLAKLRWRGKQDAYLIQATHPAGTETGTAFLDIDKDKIASIYEENKTNDGDTNDPKIITIRNGANIGYRYTNYTYPDGELKASPGETVLSVLNRICSACPNITYFFDFYGVFHVGEVATRGKQVDYRFNANNSLISKNTLHPQYSHLKNDFIVWGETSDNAGQIHSILCHYAFDANPPMVPDGTQIPVATTKTGYHVESMALVTNSSSCQIAIKGICDKSCKELIIHQWNISKEHLGSTEIELTYKQIDESSGRFIINLNVELNPDTSYIWFTDDNSSPTNIQISGTIDGVAYTQRSCETQLAKANDDLMRIFLTGPENNPYYAEIQGFYMAEGLRNSNNDDENNSATRSAQSSSDTSGYSFISDYYGLFLDATQGPNYIPPSGEDNSNKLNNSAYSIDVSVIGRRTKVFTNRGINCVAPPTIAINYVLNAIDIVEDDIPGTTEIKNYQLNVDSKIREGCALGGTDFPGMEFLQSCIEYYTHFNETETITIQPLYYLHEGAVIWIEQPKKESENQAYSHKYTINTFSIPLDTKSQMTLQCTYAGATDLAGDVNSGT